MTFEGNKEEPASYDREQAARLGITGDATVYEAMTRRGLSAGDFHGAIMAEVRRAVEQQGRKPLEMVRLGLARLEMMRLISPGEYRGLLHTIGLIFAAEHGDRGWRDVCLEARDYYQSLVLDRQAGPTALAIASIAADSATTGFLLTSGDSGQVKQGVMAAAAGNSTGGALGADVGGAVGGAYSGGILGGPWGAAAGATFGAVGASIGAVVGGILDKSDDPT